MEKNIQNKELRCLHSRFRIERRDSGKVKIRGYAAVFDRLSNDLGGFRERIAPGAFKEALEYSDCRALYNHDPNFVLGRESAGTLKLKQDKSGLFMEIDPPDTSFARDLVESIKRGDISEQSFSFVVGRDNWDGIDDPKKESIRTILKVSRLYDVGPVSYAAYQDTTVAVSSMQAARYHALHSSKFCKVGRTLARASWYIDPFLRMVDGYIAKTSKNQASRVYTNYKKFDWGIVDKAIGRAK